MANEEYQNSILKWRQEVDNNLRRENGWLALAGLYWLRKGINLIGSDPESDILLPTRAPHKLGTFEFDGNNVMLEVESNVPVEVNGVATRSALLDADQEDVPSFITFNDIRMVVLRRSKGVGIRLWDNSREERHTFPSRQWYPVKEEFRVPATYTRYEVPKIVKMPDILGAILDELQPRTDAQPYKSQITFVKDRPGHDKRYAIDASKLERELGWKPKYPKLEDIVQNAWEWHRKHPSGYR